jgi:hypothetical protein
MEARRARRLAIIAEREAIAKAKGLPQRKTPTQRKEEAAYARGFADAMAELNRLKQQGQSL